MRSELHVDVPRPRRLVFPTVLDNLSEWSETCVEDEVLEQVGESEPGTTFRVVTQESGRRMEFTGVVTAHRPPEHSACRLSGPAFDIHVAYDFEEVEGGTRVTQRSTVEAKGLFKLLFFLLRPLMRRKSCESQAKELDAMRAYCERVIPPSE
jgi:hypothetical protein